LISVASNKEHCPELMVLANSAIGIYRRFQGWPDLTAQPEVLRQLLTGPEQLNQETKFALERTELLLPGAEPPRLALPVYEQLPLAKWEGELSSAINPFLGDLRQCLKLVARRWLGQGLPAWSDSAHSFVVNYLLWAVGGRLLLAAWQAEAAAVVVESLPESQAIWQGFARANQQAGVSCPIGQLYDNSVDIRDLLDKPEVVQALQTISDQRTMVVATPIANRVLGRMSAMSSDRLGDGSQKVTWPWLTAEALNPLQAELGLFSQALHLLQQHAVLPLVNAAVEDLPFQPVDLAFAAYALLVNLLANDWVEAKLLP
jgi:hypothetical protein